MPDFDPFESADEDSGIPSADPAAEEYASTAAALATATDSTSEEFVTDAWDDARYLLMRIVRFVILLATEFALLWVLMGIAKSALFLWASLEGRHWASHGGGLYMDAIANHPGIGLAFGLFAFPLLWMLMYAIGGAYRFQTTKPGLNARRCHRCRIVIPDELHCPNCESLRLARVASWILGAMSGAVTALFVIHDFLMLLLGMYLMGGKRK